MISWLKKKIIRQIINKQVDKPLANFKTNRFKFLKRSPKYSVVNFGNKNKKIFFYIIKVDSGGGIFSNFLFVLNHLQIAEKFNFIPLIDMENFYTTYNQRNLINKTYNSWLYYFKQVSNYTLQEAYKSKNVVLTHNFSSEDMPKDYALNKDLKRIFKKYIRIHPEFLKNAEKFAKKNFKNNKVLGVHFRGGEMRTVPNHPLPPPPEQMTYVVDRLLKTKKFNKIFLVTHSLKYFNLFKKRYGKLVCYRNTFRSNERKLFEFKLRKNHRYEMGRDALEEMLILSKLNYLVCSRSGLSQLAVMTSKRKMNVCELLNGTNSKKILYAQVKWFLKRYLPESLGGFKKIVKINFKTISYKKNK